MRLGGERPTKLQAVNAVPRTLKVQVIHILQVRPLASLFWSKTHNKTSRKISRVNRFYQARAMCSILVSGLIRLDKATLTREFTFPVPRNDLGWKLVWMSSQLHIEEIKTSREREVEL
jgi:hypothetical protein